MRKKLEHAEISVSEPFNPNATISAEEFINTARSYVGTPYASQGRSRNGTDCGGLLLMVGRELHLTDLEVLGYSQNPDGKTFDSLLNMVLVKRKNRNNVQPGDIIACDYGEGIQHTAIVVRRDSETRILVIHAKRKGGVCEQYLHGVDYRGWVGTYRLRHLK